MKAPPLTLGRGRRILFGAERTMRILPTSFLDFHHGSARTNVVGFNGGALGGALTVGFLIGARPSVKRILGPEDEKKRDPLAVALGDAEGSDKRLLISPGIKEAFGCNPRI